MSGTIQGLSCAACKNALLADGVTCAACSAPHHWPCFASAGHCASCQAAKAPLPFGVVPLARPAGTSGWVAAAVLVAVLASFGALAVAALNHRAPPPAPAPIVLPPVSPMVLPPPPPQVELALPVPPAPPAPAVRPNTNAGFFDTLLVGSGGRTDPACLSSKNGGGAFRGLKEQIRKELTRQKPAADPSANGRIVRHPGRITSYLSDTLVSSGDNDAVRVGLEGTFTRVAFVQAEVRQMAGPSEVIALRVEGRVRERDPKTGRPVWVSLGRQLVPPTGRRWYRFDGPERFDELKFMVDGSGVTMTFHALAALLEERPQGKVVECARAATVRALTGGAVVLATATGREARVPAELLSVTQVEGNVAVASPSGTLVARLARDGSVNVFDPRANMMRSWGTHISSMHAARDVAWLASAEDDAKGWLNGIGAYTLLERWKPPVVRDATFSPALEAAAVLNGDGTVSVYRPQGGAGMPMTDFEDLDEIGATVSWAEDRDGSAAATPRRARAQMRASAMGLTYRFSGGTASRSQQELMRWLKMDVVPRFRKLVGPARELKVSDRVWIGWRNAFSSFGLVGTVHVTMLDRDSVLVRGAERGSRAAALANQGEFELHRDFLPEHPAARVGQSFWIESKP